MTSTPLSVQQHPRDQGSPHSDHRQVNKLNAPSASVPPMPSKVVGAIETISEFAITA
jgi:hypothetical protein